MNKCKERFVRSVVRVLAAIITTIPCFMPKQQCNGIAGRSWALHSPPMIPVTLHRLQWWRRNKYKNTRINILFLLNQLLGAHTDRRINKMYMLNKYSGCCRTHQSDELFISSVRVFCSIHDDDETVCCLFPECVPIIFAQEQTDLPLFLLLVSLPTCLSPPLSSCSSEKTTKRRSEGNGIMGNHLEKLPIQI